VIQMPKASQNMYWDDFRRRVEFEQDSLRQQLREWSALLNFAVDVVVLHRLPPS